MAKFEIMYGNVSPEEYRRARRELADFTEVIPEAIVDPTSLDRFATFVGPNLARIIRVDGNCRQKNMPPHLKLSGVQATYDDRGTAIILARTQSEKEISQGHYLRDFTTVPLSWKGAKPTDAMLTIYNPSDIVPQNITPLRPSTEADVATYMQTLQHGVAQILNQLQPIDTSDIFDWEWQ